MTKNKKMMISALPFVALVVLLAVFCGIVSSKGYRLDMINCCNRCNFYLYTGFI